MLKDLPKDLIDAVGEVVKESVKNRQEKYRSLVKSALEQFKVQSFAQLSETEQRIFSEWVTSRLDEEGCGHRTEDCDCPDDDLLQLKGRLDAQSGLPELGEESEDEDSEEVKEEDEKEKELEEDDIPGQDDSQFHKEEEDKEEEEKLEESCYASPEPCSAIGHRQGYELPKACDVLKDSDVLSGTTTYRLLLQFVNGRPEILPPLTLPGAPSVEALLDIVGDFSDPNGVIDNAIADALDVPSERPEHKGNDK